MTGWVADRGYGYLRWEPDDSQHALDALVAVGGTGVDGESDLPDDGLVDLSDQPDVRAAVRKEFDALTGGSRDATTTTT